ncbi:MAG: hypothetical protein JXR78_15315 [Victivallales bacterium]|nr:hypothetical protein [Victivallales bacterium]
MKNYISFCRNYHKLGDEGFTTIRGASAIKEYHEGQIVDILKTDVYPSGGKGELLCRAIIVDMEVLPLIDIPLDVLQRDGAFGKWKPGSHAEFMGLINSMRKYGKMDSVRNKVTLIKLIKTDGGN